MCVYDQQKKMIIWVVRERSLQTNRFFYNIPLNFYSFCCCSVIVLFILDLLINRIWKKITSIFLRIRTRFYSRYKITVPERLRKDNTFFVLSSLLIFTELIWRCLGVCAKDCRPKSHQVSVHSHLLTVPELCQHFNQSMSCIQSTLRRWLNFRREHPLRFCLTNTYICMNLAIVGCYVPGIIISYIIGIVFLLCPPVIYYRVPQRFRQKLEPVTSRIMYVMSFFNIFWVIIRAIRGDGCTTENEINSHVGLPSDEIKLSDLYPEADPTALSTAATESEGERTPDHLTPALSENHSIENSDDDHETDIEQDLAEGLGEEMPSFDDHTDDELLDNKSSDVIQFVPTHFDSDSDDGEFGLDARTGSTSQKDNSVDIERNIAENIVAQAMGSMMKMALKGFSNPEAPDLDQQMSDEENELHEYETATVKRRRKVRPTATQDYVEHSDTELADDFEFLDSTELDDH
ncbi:reticulophagy regulator 3-like isoform X2 [Octopus bimaculoides]|uniref:reticulophagy regulator 3-like isoform X2 n=1 Tax=Octopus bimaculoides TaxID=37653 RepID=UPI0022DF9176|nr:reticulophagy regulator 3-like isoform X2 [Octopus bimaculoides]